MTDHIVRFRKDGEIGYGRLSGRGQIQPVAGSPFSGPETGPLNPVGPSFAAGTADLLAPVEAPRIFGVGLNYVSHAREMNLPEPTVPMLFMKPSTTVTGPGAPIVYPVEAQNLHFEAEVAVVIGRRARRIAEAEAGAVILGYTCGNDVSERVIQRAEMDQGCLLIGKGYDSFNPLGPAIATGLDPAALTLIGRVNGEERQRIDTSDLIYSIPYLVSYLSQAITLLPGDVIMTGTPAGVGPVVPGDLVEIEIEGVGILSNPVVAESRR